MRARRLRGGSLRMAMVGLWLAALPLTAVADEQGESSQDDPALRGYLSANGLLNRGLYELAAAEYRTFLQEHAAHAKVPVARYGLAVCLYRLGDYEAAATELERVGAADGLPFAAEVLALLGQCRMARRQYGPAVEAFAELVSKHRKHALADDGAALLVEACYRDGRYDETIKQCGRFVRRWKVNPLRERVLLYWGAAHMGRGEWPEAIERLSELMEAYPKGSFRDHAALLLAQCSERNGAIDRALRWYRQVLTEKKSLYEPDALFGLARLEQSKGHAGQAGELLDRLLREFPESALIAEALLLRGRAWFDQQDFARAAEAFEAARAKSDDLADRAAFWLAKCKLRETDYAGAVEQLARAIEKHPKSSLLAEMRYDRAVALAQAGEDEAARRALREFRSEHPTHTMAADALHLLATVEHRLRHFDRSRELCREFLRAFPEHPLAVSMTFLAAENDFLSSEYDEARRQLASFLAEHGDAPQAKQATYRFGLALYRLDRLDEALPPLTRAAEWAESEPAFRQCYLALGDIHFQRSEWKQAESLLTRYLAGGAGVAAADDALLKLGLAQQRQGRNEDACATFERLLKEFPQSPQRLHGLFELGQTLVAAERFDQARDTFERVLKNGTDSRFVSYALNHLGNIALRRGRYAAAAEHFQRVLTANPEPAIAADALFQQGQALLAIERYKQAEAVFARFLKEHSEHANAVQAQARLALALARQDRPEEALAAIDRVDLSAMDEASRVAFAYERAWCLRKLGRREEAKDGFARLVEACTGGSEHVHALLELAELEAGDQHCAAAVPLLRELRKLAVGSDTVPADVLAQGTYRLAVCEFEQGHHEEAAKLLDEFLRAYPGHPLVASAGYFCGEAHLKCGRHERAVEHLTRVVEATPRDDTYGPALLRLGEALAALQRWDRSEQVFGQHLREFKDSEYWYQAQFGVGWARENQGRYDEAIAAYRPVTMRHKGPTAARAQFQIGECLFAKRQHEAAVRELLKVDILYAYAEWSAAALYEAGRCFEEMGKHVEARAQFKRVQKQYGQTKWAKLAAQRLAAVTGGALPGRAGASPAQPAPARP